MNYQKLADELDAICRICRESIKPIVVTDEHFKIINRLMRQKKMTKAEAFEWLDGKKIRTEGNHERVLRKLFNLGFVWKNLRDTRIDLGWQSGEVYGLTISGDEVAWWTTPHLFDTHGADEVSADDVLGIKIIMEKRPRINAEELDERVREIQEHLCGKGFSFVITETTWGIIKGDVLKDVIKNEK